MNRTRSGSVVPYDSGDYTRCASCRRKLRVKVSLYLDIPADLAHRLSKTALRRSDVRIEGAGWPTMTLYCANEECRHPTVRHLGAPNRKRAEPRFEAIPDYGSHMTLANFVECCQAAVLTDDDGSGCWATATKMSRRSVSCSDPRAPKWATHVVWFNK